MKTAIYLRVSTEEQAENGYGLDAQRAKCLAMAEVKDWQVAAEYTDEGISGTIRDRPGLAAMLQAICNGELQAVIMSSLDRLGRSTRLVLDIVERLDECKAEIVSCAESLDTSTPSGRFVLRMFASLAELERDNIVSRTTAGRNARGHIDGDRGGRLPMGYERRADGPAVIEQEAAIVRDIFRSRANGSTMQAIADSLNQRGIRTRRGAQWHPSSIREVLSNELAYRGGNRWQSPAQWPAILE